MDAVAAGFWVDVPPCTSNWSIRVCGACGGSSLAPMASLMDFDVTVIDPRRAFATDSRFPGVKVMQDWADEAFEKIGLDASTAVVTLTHDPKLDDPALESALKSDVFYVGALGSRKTHARRVERLAAANSKLAGI